MDSAFEVEIGNSKLESGGPPRVVLSHKAAMKLRAWTLAAPGEISGFGSLQEKVDGFDTTLYVDDVWLMEQECGGGHSTISTDGIFKFMDRHVTEDQHVRFWWHSHAAHGLFWSGLDESTQVQLSETAHWLCLVTNKAACNVGIDGLEGSLASYFVAKPTRLAWHKLPITVESAERDLLEEAAEELRGMITNLPDSGVSIENDRLVINGWKPEIVRVPVVELEPEADVPADVTNPTGLEAADVVDRS